MGVCNQMKDIINYPKHKWSHPQKKKYRKICVDCGSYFETDSQFRSVCPDCSNKSFAKAGLG